MSLGFQRNPEGSVLYRCGGTTVMVAASISERVPSWLDGQAKGWVTAEYAMHPRANRSRQGRDGRRGRVDGRSTEIQRLIGRSLRAGFNLKKLGERAITVDCDVIDADGGTRTASISAGFVACALVVHDLKRRGLVAPGAIREPLGAISVGLVDGKPMLDLDYNEDSAAEVDLNVVATASGRLVEVQGTAEGEPIARKDFDAMVDLAIRGVQDVVTAQRAALASAGIELDRLFA